MFNVPSFITCLCCLLLHFLKYNFVINIMESNSETVGNCLRFLFISCFLKIEFYSIFQKYSSMRDCPPPQIEKHLSTDTESRSGQCLKFLPSSKHSWEGGKNSQGSTYLTLLKNYLEVAHINPAHISWPPFAAREAEKCSFRWLT